MSDKDRDPSSPKAIRPAEGNDSAGSARKRESTTDPGLGPPQVSTTPGQEPGTCRSGVATPRGRPVSIVVPPPTRRAPHPARATGSSLAQSKKDSVELLLEGMAGPLLDRTRTMRQSDGEAAAAYYARHGVRPARTAPLGEPKVQAERWPLSAILRPSKDRGPGALEATEPSPRLPGRALARRALTAVLAGLLVALALFVLMRLTSPGPTSSEP